MLPILSSLFSYTTLVTIGCLLGSAYCWAIYRNSYWRRHGMQSFPGVPFFGTLWGAIFGRESYADLFRKIYDADRSTPVCGIQVFHTPCIFVRDPELAKKVLIKDFNSFSDRYANASKHDMLSACNLFFARKSLWRRIRVKLTPFFTSGKMRNMFPLINNVAEQMDRKMMSMPLDDPAKKSFVSEIKDFAARYTTDVIATCAYGVQANSLNDPNSGFRRNGREIFEFGWLRSWEVTALFFLPDFVQWFGFGFFAKKPAAFIRDTINYVMKERESSKTRRNDLIDTLIDIKNDPESVKVGETALQGDVLVAQAAIFFTAGYETSSSTISFGLYELSKQPEIQNRLRQEIKEVLQQNNGEISYETINSMEYMQMVVSEILRMHPILPFLDRRCTPNANEKGYSLEPFHDFVIPKDTPVIIPIAAIQRDPKFFPNPDHFDPERFAPANKHKLVPYSFMPFGVGPHNCIGERFGWIQSKLGLLNILKNHYVTPSDRMPEEIVYSRKSLFLQSEEGGIYVNMVRDPLI